MCLIEALRVMEAVKAGKETYFCLPWGDLDNIAVKYHAKQDTLPFRPEIASDEQWYLVTRMCALDPSKRIKISSVIDELARLAYEQAAMPLASISLECAPAIVSSARERLLEIQGARSEIPLYVELWGRIEVMLGNVDSTLNKNSLLGLSELVGDAETAMTALLSSDESLVSLAGTTMRYYELHRQMDKYLEALECSDVRQE